ncbi:hypothetical protein MNBD_GAMMA12-2865 [hydrothermal vent metagenome]|uniref:Class III cytochrome C domain-containing protein n=1 Tax=hydrothermal vent metagenome TaxID=652676 RepID=A0A3B0YM70_9ZZZZ
MRFEKAMRAFMQQVKRFIQLLMLMMVVFFATTLHAAKKESTLSPGQLIQGHAEFDTDCKKCHLKFNRKEQRKLCLDCHKKVRKDLKIRKGFHGLSKLIQQKQCANCHTEHIGRKGDIIKMNKNTFDHKKTNFPLKGKHRQTSCKSCHKPKKLYRDASPKCYSCHKDDDRHKKRLGKKCEDCHKPKGWRHTEFDHSETEFELTGAHKKIACENCHANEQYKKTVKECHSCHKINDIHKGQLGKKCNTCHTTKKWKNIGFNHDKETEFPLKGQHKKIKCRDCHASDPKKKKQPAGCLSCHKADDRHHGLFGKRCATCHNSQKWAAIVFNHNKDTKFKLEAKHKKAACGDCHKKHLFNTKTSMQCQNCHIQDSPHGKVQKLQCNKCHNVKGWSKNILFDHGLTKFPLIGLHSVAQCRQCHVTRPYKALKSNCYNCHKSDDTHKLKLSMYCETCHTPNDWKIWKFDHTKQTKYPLKGKHKSVHCHSCHKKKSKKKKLKLSKQCVSCHSDDDPHDGQFGENCSRCHTFSSFKDVDL